MVGSIDQVPGTGPISPLDSLDHTPHITPHHPIPPLPASDAHVEGLVVDVGQGGPRLDAPALHEGQQLVRDLSQHILGQSCHAQHLVSRSVYVVPEWHKLEREGKEVATAAKKM